MIIVYLLCFGSFMGGYLFRWWLQRRYEAKNLPMDKLIETFNDHLANGKD